MTPSQNAQNAQPPTSAGSQQKIGSSIVLKSLSILLGLFFIFIGAMKLTPHLSKELHKDLVSGKWIVLFNRIANTRSVRRLAMIRRWWKVERVEKLDLRSTHIKYIQYSDDSRHFFFFLWINRERFMYFRRKLPFPTVNAVTVCTCDIVVHMHKQSAMQTCCLVLVLPLFCFVLAFFFAGLPPNIKIDSAKMLKCALDDGFARAVHNTIQLCLIWGSKRLYWKRKLPIQIGGPT